MQVSRDASGNVTRIRMRRPYDMHQHFRSGNMLKMVAPMIAKRFAGAIVMPNTVPPITTVKLVEDYLSQVIKALPRTPFRPMMTLYLTDTLEPKTVEYIFKNGIGHVAGIKYYPPGLTTNSDSGVSNPVALWTKGTKPNDCLRVLADCGGVFLIHAADGVVRSAWKHGGRFYTKGDELDPYDQERHFMEATLPHIVEVDDRLKISVEHLSTAYGADQMRYWGKERPCTGCSLTAHHLLLNRRDVFRGGFRTHRHWWPIIQSQEHQQELRKLAAEDHSFVWLGSDSAPHVREKKESDCCVGGVLMAHAGIELYVEAFDQMGALDQRFERFASINGPNFYDIAQSGDTLELRREEWTVQNIVRIEENGHDKPVVPFRLGEKIQWKLVD